MPRVIRSPHTEPSYFLYALFCEDGGGPGYVKIGYTQRIGRRISSLRTSSPIPAKMLATVEIGASEIRAKQIESALHQRFADRKSTGEWFRFSFGDPQHRQLFNASCREVFRSHIGPDYPWWSTMSIEAMDRLDKERRRDLVRGLGPDKLKRINLDDKRRRQAWKELA